MQVIVQRVVTVIFRVEADIRRDAWQDVIGGQEDAIAFAEEADMPIGVTWRPDNTGAFTYQVNGCSILNLCNQLVSGHANNLHHGFCSCLREPRLTYWLALF